MWPSSAVKLTAEPRKMPKAWGLRSTRQRNHRTRANDAKSRTYYGARLHGRMLSQDSMMSICIMAVQHRTGSRNRLASRLCEHDVPTTVGADEIIGRNYNAQNLGLCSIHIIHNHLRSHLHNQNKSSDPSKTADMTPPTADTTIFEDVIIFTGDDFIDHGYVVVHNGQIVKVGAGSSPPLDSPVKRISKPGCTLMPGLLDCHLHGLFGNEHCIEESLRFGATTVLDMHNELPHIQKLQKVRLHSFEFDNLH